MQSRKWSIIETAISVILGFCIAQLLILYVLPFWGFQADIYDSLSISAMFTSVSLTRGYIIRRVFNYYHSPFKTTQRYIKRHYKNVKKK